MKDRTAIIITLLCVVILMAAFSVGQELQAARQASLPVCFEDEVIVWDGRTDSHDICVPMDNIVDMGIENAIQNGVLQFTPEFAHE